MFRGQQSLGDAMNINISDNINETIRDLDRYKRNIPFAASKAINDLAFKISRQVMPKEADDIFEGKATPFTKRGFKYTKSDKRNLTAWVFIDKAQNDYMKFMVQGGTRFPKKRAILVSTKQSKLNSYGNIPRGTLNQMINDRTKFFAGIPKGRQGANYEGIWERYGRGKDGQRIRMVAKYTDKAGYQPLFPFGTIANTVVFSRSDGFAILFRANLARALAY